MFYKSEYQKKKNTMLESKRLGQSVFVSHAQIHNYSENLGWKVVNSPANKTYTIGKKSYHLVDKREQTQSFSLQRALEIIAGLAILLFTLGLALISKTVRQLFNGRKVARILKPIDLQGASQLGKRSQMATPLGDQDIIAFLLQQGYGAPVEKGSDGRCLFRSMASQIEEEDLALVPSSYPGTMPFAQWETLSLVEKSDLLRTWAMESERLFMSSLSDQIGDLSAADLEWIGEFYKDMVQELEHMSYSHLRSRFQSTDFEEKLRYCKEHFSDYYARTKRPTNWAGTTELIALSRLFQRAVEAFGNDFASSEWVSYTSDGKVLPYYSSKGRLPKISIFQCHGGGHYRLLPRVEERVQPLGYS